jgi:hypothetical protein
MPRQRKPSPRITTGIKRLQGVATFSPIELTSAQSSQLLQILSQQPISVQGGRAIREFSAICGVARAGRDIFVKSRPKRSYSQHRQPGQRGIPAKHYLAILASDLAKLMRDYELTPKVIRLDPWECTAGAAYHRLFKLALQVSGDGRMSDSMRARYLTRGLAIERPHY